MSNHTEIMEVWTQAVHRIQSGGKKSKPLPLNLLNREKREGKPSNPSLGEAARIRVNADVIRRRPVE